MRLCERRREMSCVRKVVCDESSEMSRVRRVVLEEVWEMSGVGDELCDMSCVR